MSAKIEIDGVMLQKVQGKLEVSVRHEGRWQLVITQKDDVSSFVRIKELENIVYQN